MRCFGIATALAVFVTATVGFSGQVAAQAGPGGAINPQRDCQTVVQCRFTRGDVYRGCISAYTCRRCRMVTARCTTNDGRRRRRTCRRMRCTWG